MLETLEVGTHSNGRYGERPGYFKDYIFSEAQTKSQVVSVVARSRCMDDILRCYSYNSRDYDEGAQKSLKQGLLKLVYYWIESYGLSLTTEAKVIPQSFCDYFTVGCGDNTNAVMYLGISLDSKLTYWKRLSVHRGTARSGFDGSYISHTSVINRATY